MYPKKLLKAAAAVSALALFTTALSGCGSWFGKIKYALTPEPTLAPNVEKLSKVPTDDRSQADNAYGYQSLDTDELKAVYLTVEEELAKSYSEDFWLENATLSMLDEALTAYELDHPEVFWLNLSSRYSYIDYGDSLEVGLNFELEGEELDNAKERFNQRVDEIIAEAPADATDYQIEIYINDYIIDNCEYQSGASMCHTAYGSLMNGLAVCDGYSKAFQLLCNRLGVECVGINGRCPEFNEENGESSDTGHMWNGVKIGGDWYYIDVTWNDGDVHIQRHLYFNLTTEEILKNHTISPLFGGEDYEENALYNVFVPECTAEDYNYLKRECVTVYDLDEDSELLASFIQAARGQEPYFDFLVSDSLDYSEVTREISDSYGYIWIDAVNRYLDGGVRVSTDSSFYTYKTVNAVTFNLQYDTEE